MRRLALGGRLWASHRHAHAELIDGGEGHDHDLEAQPVRLALRNRMGSGA